MNDNVTKLKEMSERVARRRKVHEQGLLESQKKITYGDNVLLITTGEYGFSAGFGRVWSKNYTMSLCGISEEVADKRYAKGFRFMMICGPEMLDGRNHWVHITRVYPISPEHFDEAKAANYDPERVSDYQWFHDAVSHIVEALEREGYPQRPQCPKCKFRTMFLRRYYQGRSEHFVLVSGDNYITGTLANDAVADVTSTHLWCSNCEYETPDLGAPTIIDASAEHKSMIESVFGYGPGLPKPDWD